MVAVASSRWGSKQHHTASELAAQEVPIVVWGEVAAGALLHARVSLASPSGEGVARKAARWSGPAWWQGGDDSPSYGGACDEDAGGNGEDPHDDGEAGDGIPVEACCGDRTCCSLFLFTCELSTASNR